MQEEDKEISPLKRRHFQRLHEKIQSKYNDMQKKLEKAKSVDSLSTISDDFNYQGGLSESNSDLRESNEALMYSHDVSMQQMFVENTHEQEAVSQLIEVTEITVTGAEDKKTFTLDEDWETVEHKHTETRVSLESLHVETKDNKDVSRPTPSPKTIRDRIESRFLAAKEKRDRKKEEKEKHERDRQMKEKHTKDKKDTKEKVDKIILSNSSKDIKVSRKNKVATVTIALIEATNFEATPDEKSHFLQCRLRLGTEKCKSKVVKSNGPNVKWQEIFNLHMFDDHIMLELSLWDKDGFLGRTMVDLSELEKEKTHKMSPDLSEDESSVKLFFLLTITGTSQMNVISEINDIENAQREFMLGRTPAWYRIERNMTNIGQLLVIVYGAKGLIAHDCYCLLKLNNERLQTHTEYKTSDPNWMKIFSFKISDITSILEISVIEEKKAEEIGKISVPLLRVRNGEKVWYALKDHTQRERAKGNNPRILLEMTTSWNLTKAAVRLVNPKEVDLLETEAKFDRRMFARNLTRAKAVSTWILDSLTLLKTCFEWESRKMNALALISWTLFCYFFKMWMTPLLLIIPFVRYRPKQYYLVNWRRWISRKDSLHLEVVKNEKEEKSSLRQKINSLQEMVQTVQNGIGRIAGIGESIKNLFNFTVPFVSLFALFLIVMVAFIMYIIPFNYILICWGIHKFTRKILRPNRIPNNEILDLLSRVPNDETLLDCEELPLEHDSDDETA